MKRDMDLCREILRQMEVHPNPEGPIKIKIEGRPDQEITYHLHLLRQADLIEAIEKTTFAGMAYAPQRLTWKGTSSWTRPAMTRSGARPRSDCSASPGA